MYRGQPFEIRKPPHNLTRVNPSFILDISPEFFASFSWELKDWLAVQRRKEKKREETKKSTKRSLYLTVKASPIILKESERENGNSFFGFVNSCPVAGQWVRWGFSASKAIPFSFQFFHLYKVRFFGLSKVCYLLWLPLELLELLSWLGNNPVKLLCFNGIVLNDKIDEFWSRKLCSWKN